jgi:acyl-coenzyme A thioesterase PaaI-like protein
LKLDQELIKARENREFQRLISEIPYARLIGMSCIPIGSSLLFTLPPNRDNIGNASLPALHGGVIAGFMEMSASLHILLTQNTTTVPKVVDFAIDYLSPGRLLESYAECRVIRQGNKIINVSVTAWQDYKEKPMATARAHLLLAASSRRETKTGGELH